MEECLQAAAFKVWSAMLCDSCSIYNEKWNGVLQLLYLLCRVEMFATAVSVQWGVEWGATDTIFTVRGGMECDWFKCTVRSVLSCVSYNILM